MTGTPTARGLLVRLLPALAAIALLVPAALAAGGARQDAALLLPDLDQEVPSGLEITRGGARADPTWRLGFRSAVGNVGAGPLIIEGQRPSPRRRTMRAGQVIVSAGAPRQVVPEVGRLRYVRSPDHQHWHLLGFDRYELRRPGGDRALVRDRKTGFCLGDRYPMSSPPPARPPEPVYTTRCGLERPALLGVREGISVGYGDDYRATLEGQWLALNGLRAGRYLLIHRVNADRRLRELAYDNNAASLLLRLRWRRQEPRVDVLARCPGRDRCAAGP
jgi:hypothetical protein